MLADLARHPATARLVAFKLARHFIGNRPVLKGLLKDHAQG